MEKGQVRQIGFARRLKERLDDQHPDLSKKLDETDLLVLFDLFFMEVAYLLRSGYRVIFEGFVSFYTKPIKRKCTNLHTGKDWMTYKRRLRWNPAPDMKVISEVEITEEQYLEETKKEKTPTGA
jgi:nucleoid DNA-binding protein